MDSGETVKKYGDYPEPGEITRLLSDVAAATPGAIESLVVAVRQDLRRRAAVQLAGGPPWQTLQPTALVHEAFLRIFGRESAPSWENRRHFFMAASRAMHDVLVERARKATSLKAGGGHKRVPLSAENLQFHEAEKLLEFTEVLEDLGKGNPRQADIVRLRFFTGMTKEEIALALGISDRTVQREWAVAKVRLKSKLGRILDFHFPE